MKSGFEIHNGELPARKMRDRSGDRRRLNIVESSDDAEERIIDRVVYVPDRRVMRLGQGRVVSVSDLPPRNTKRWVASQKAAVARVFLAGMIALDEVLTRYNLSEEELENWVRAYLSGGRANLRVKSIADRER